MNRLDASTPEEYNRLLDEDQKQDPVTAMRLMKAAPDLLEALKEALPIIESLDIGREDEDPENPLITRIRAAIVKAEGKDGL